MRKDFLDKKWTALTLPRAFNFAKVGGVAGTVPNDVLLFGKCDISQENQTVYDKKTTITVHKDSSALWRPTDL